MRVFLSYSTPDRARAESLKLAIEARDAGTEVFFAPHSLRHGTFWQPQLADAIRGADGVLLLVGTHVGPWQLIEYYEALDRHSREPSLPLVPVIIADKAPGLPFLRQLHWIETLAPDAEPTLSAVIAALKGAELPPTAQPWRIANPYPGLAALAEENAEFFFGREAKVVEVLSLIANAPQHLLALIGNSGVGKSSLVQAGVIASLKRQRLPGQVMVPWDPKLADSRGWAYLTIRPGERPLRNLAAAFVGQWFEDHRDPELQRFADGWEERLTANGKLSELIDITNESFRKSGLTSPPKVLLYIDQCEELYSTRLPRDAASRFASVLAQGLSDPRLIALTTLRADYYGRLQADSDLFPFTKRVDVLPLTKTELETVLREPAHSLGASFENENLIRLLLDSAEGQPGALPLIADHMAELWRDMQRRGDGKLRVENPAGLIQVGSTLGRRADDFLAMHRRDSQTLKRLFTLRLTHVPREGDPVKRPVLKSRCTADEWRLIEALSAPDTRLLVTGVAIGSVEPTVEIAHEILLREWATLKGWLEQEREFLAWKGDIEHARRQWDSLKGRERREALLMGRALAVANAWLETRAADVEREECDYIHTSVARDRTRKSARRAAAMAAFVLLAVFCAFAAWQWQRAEGEVTQSELARREAILQRERAENARSKADTERQRADAELDKRLVAQSQVLADLAARMSGDGDHGTAALIALEAIEKPAARTEFALDKAWRNLRERALFRGHADELNYAAFSPDGTLFATASDDKTARVWELATRKTIATLTGHKGTVLSVEFSSDGKRVVTASTDKTARIWDIATGQEIVAFVADGAVTHAKFSNDNAHILASSRDRTTRIWDAGTGKLVASVSTDSPVQSAVFTTTGKHAIAVTGSRSNFHTGRAFLLSVETGDLIKLGEGQDPEPTAVAFSISGTRAVLQFAGRVEVWDVNLRRKLSALEGLEKVFTATFSDDGTFLFTQSIDDKVDLWLAETGHKVSVLDVPVTELKRNTLTTSSMTYNVVTEPQSKRGSALAEHEVGELVAEFSPDGNRLLTLPSSGRARLWNTRTGELIDAFEERPKGIGAKFSPDGLLFIAWNLSGSTATVRDAQSGRLVHVLAGHTMALGHGPIFSPDGAHILTVSRDATARLWDTDQGRVPIELRGHENKLNQVMVSPDGSRILTTSQDDTARLWNPTTGEAIAKMAGHKARLGRALFNPNGTRILTWDFPVRTSSASTLLSYVDWNGSAPQVWAAGAGDLVAVLEGHTHHVVTARFSPDGLRIVTASLDQSARVWDTATGRQIAVLSGHKGFVLGATFSPDGTRILTNSTDGTAMLWDAASGKRTAVLDTHSDQVGVAHFSPDGRQIVTAPGHSNWMAAMTFGATVSSQLKGQAKQSEPNAEHKEREKDTTARLWDGTTGQPLTVLRGHKAPLFSAAWSPDGTLIVTASDDDTARVWQASTGQQVSVFSEHTRGVTDATFSADGKRVLSVAGDQTARLWEATTGRQIQVFGNVIGNEKGISVRVPSARAKFNREGTRVITASNDHKVHIWDGITGFPIVELEGHSGWIEDFDFGPDGRSIVTASEDGTARIWPMMRTSQELAHRVKSLLPRCLSAEQLTSLFADSRTQAPDWCHEQGKWPYPRVRYGVTLESLGAAPSGELHHKGARIKHVMANLPAAAAGVRPGDVAVAVDGQEVADVASFLSLINRPPAGSAVRVRILRTGQTIEITMIGRATEVEEDLTENNKDFGKAIRATADRLTDGGLRLLNAGSHREADALFNRAYFVANKMLGLDPTQVKSAQRVVLSYSRLGDRLKKGGKLLEAIQVYWKTIAMIERLRNLDRKNVGLRVILALAYNNLADADVDEPNSSIKARDILQHLRAEGALNANGQRLLAAIEKELADWPITVLERAVKKSVDASQYVEAVKQQERLVGELERRETDEHGRPGRKTGDALGTLGWHALFAREFDKALAATERATSLDQSLAWETNRAHALLFLDRTDEAKAVYLAHRGKKVHENDDKIWEQVIADDFNAFLKAGLKHPMMPVIGAEIGIAPAHSGN